MTSHKTLKEFKEFVPGRNGGEIYLDGTHVQVVRFVVYGTSLYSGKNKKHAYNVLVLSNKDNLILWVSKPRKGSVHDITILRDELPPFGKWTERTEPRHQTRAETDMTCGQGIRINRFPVAWNHVDAANQAASQAKSYLERVRV